MYDGKMKRLVCEVVLIIIISCFSNSHRRHLDIKNAVKHLDISELLQLIHILKKIIINSCEKHFKEE